MTETAVENEQAEQVVQVPSSAVSDEQLVAMWVDRARNDGLQLTGEGGLLQQLTKRVLESALEGEITDHVGYEKHDPAGKNNGKQPQRHPGQDRADRCRPGGGEGAP
ncbi:hypothetical protein QFZ64_000159 [Streptomyces sp. B3I8]|nr:hypothetical protein [Streptomyces sp. B3I8]